jgi:hypothetical protein
MSDSLYRFSDQALSHRKRKGGMGDLAEAVFERVYPQGWFRYGLDRPPVQVHALPMFVRYTPDYGTSKGLVEVQGFGKDQRFKLKKEKYAALDQWHQQFRVDLFAYDSHNDRYGFMRLYDFVDAWEDYGSEGMFDGTKPYMALHAKHLPVDRWVELASENRDG